MMKNRNTYQIIMAFLLILGWTNSVYACTTILVGKAASTNGSILIGRNADGYSGNIAVHFLYHEPKKIGYTYKNLEASSSRFRYHLPNHLMGYTGIPDWETGTYEEAGFNDAGIGISATETIASNPQTLKVDPYVTDKGILEEAIPTLLLPQMKTARQGVEMLGKMIETYGSGEGFGVAFVDQHEAWYLENAGGHQWLAVRLPDNAYFVSANQSRLGEVNLSDTRNYLASPTLISFALKKGLYNPKEGVFNFHKVYGKNDEFDKGYNYPRMIYLLNTYTASTKNESFTQGDFPVFLKPDHLLSLTNVEEGLQNYFQGTSHDPYTSQNPKAAVRPISVYRTQESSILETRKNLPKALAHIQYINFGMTALGIYIPFYQTAKIPDDFKIGTDKADDKSAYWKLRKLQMMAMLNFPKYAPIVQKAYRQLNIQIQKDQKQFEQKYLAIYKKNPVAAKKLLDKFTQETVNRVMTTTASLTNKLITLESTSINKKYLFDGA